MTSSRAKHCVCSHLLFDRSFVAAVTESVNASDVFGVTKALVSYEYEIKVNRQDLLNELAIVNRLAGKAPKPQRVCNGNKWSKHETYLLPPLAWTSRGAQLHRLVPPFVPNYFSFAVPADLADLADERLLAPQYGLVLIGANAWNTQVVRKPIALNQAEVPDRLLLALIRKASTESYFCRQRLSDALPT